MNRKLSILSSHWFLTGLLLLLLNDFILKNYYHNWLTGKVSDFTGLFIFPLFWTALFPAYKRIIFWSVALLFIFFKSSYSEFLINAWNNVSFLNISRTIDDSDFLALLSLPFAFYIETKLYRSPRYSINSIFPLVLSSFAFLATSKTENTCFDKGTAVYHIKNSSREGFINDIKHSGFIVSFTKYNNTKYDDEYCEIQSLKDSIENLVIIIGDFNKVDSTVEISLGCWTIRNITNSYTTEEQRYEKQKELVKNVFETEVLERMKKKLPYK